MNWPSIVIGAGISAWVHGALYAVFATLGLTAFGQFAMTIGWASALVFIIGLIVRAVKEGEANEERVTARYNEGYESRYNDLRKTVERHGTRLTEWTEWGKGQSGRIDTLRKDLDALKADKSAEKAEP